MHEVGNAYDQTLTNAEIYGASGVTFAIVDGAATIESSLRGQGQSVQPGILQLKMQLLSISFEIIMQEKLLRLESAEP